MTTTSGEALQPRIERIPESQLQEAIARFAGEAYKLGSNPVELFDSEHQLSEGGNSDLDPIAAEVRDRLQRALSDRVLQRGEVADGSISRAAAASPEDVLGVAMDAYKSSLISAKYEAMHR